jgi:FkbM family methyltransferase
MVIRKKWFITAGLVIVVELYLLLFTDTIAMILATGMYLANRSDCPFQQTLSAPDWQRRYADTTKRIYHMSRLESTEGDLRLWSTPQGRFWMPKESVPLIFGVLAEQELRVYGTGPTGVRPGDVVIDCGADVGTFTRLALNMGASQVIAIEPAKQKQPCLQRNFRSEIASRRVIICAKGVWDKEEILALHGGVTIPSDQVQPNDEAIQLTTIDNLVTELNLERVNFIKMDIEGAESRALKGAVRTVSRFKPRLSISTEHSNVQFKEVLGTIRAIAPGTLEECGPCANLGGRIVPHVLYFH